MEGLRVFHTLFDFWTYYYTLRCAPRVAKVIAACSARSH